MKIQLISLYVITIKKRRKTHMKETHQRGLTVSVKVRPGSEASLGQVMLLRPSSGGHDGGVCVGSAWGGLRGSAWGMR